MSTPDLPVELWLEILAYLPRTTLHKMIGINRLLFELALNDIYEEVRFISDDKNMVKTFEQLEHLGIARRVRHLYIRPAFLPGMDDVGSPLQQKLVSGMACVRNLGKRSNAEHISKKILLDSTRRTFETAQKAVKSCPNLYEITVVIHDLALTSSFMTFLDSLWSSDSIGPNIRKISIDTTVTKLPILLRPLTNRASSLKNLEEFDINISVSRVQQTPLDWHFGSTAFLSFLEAFKGNLTAFAFSSLVIFDIGNLFESFPILRKLKKFEFLAVFNVTSVPHTEGFTKFIARHAPTLETLTIKPHARQLTLHVSDDSYSLWLNHEDALKSDRLYSFTQVVLPKLKALEVGLREVYWGWDPQITDKPLLPNLSRVTPNLKRLVVTDTRLFNDRLLSLVEALGQRNGGCLLQELVISCSYLCPPLFDALAKNLPNLKKLTIDYTWLSGIVVVGGDSSALGRETEFHNTMPARRYPRWGLKYLRLVNQHSCGSGHPIPSVMKSVAESLSSDILLDCEFACQCNPLVDY